MTRTNVPTLDQYWAALADAVPRFSAEEQTAAVTLYRELARGRPVSAEQLAAALQVRPERAHELLERPSIKAFLYPDEHGRVLGFGGLTVAPMQHKFEIGGRMLWTWCAWDTLFIPEILGAEARVESPDPVSGASVRLTVTPDDVAAVEPPSAVISFLHPDAEEFTKSAANVMASFCHYVLFFTSPETGERWTAKHPGTFLYTIDDAVELARRLNAKNFGRELSARSGSDVVAPRR